MRQYLAQVAHAVGSLGIGKPARRKHASDLPVEFRPVGDDDHGRMRLGFVAAELECQPEHRQALARPLRVPDNATAALWRSECAN